jgi:hypothetical protein
MNDSPISTIDHTCFRETLRRLMASEVAPQADASQGHTGSQSSPSSRTRRAFASPAAS